MLPEVTMTSMSKIYPFCPRLSIIVVRCLRLESGTSVNPSYSGMQMQHIDLTATFSVFLHDTERALGTAAKAPVARRAALQLRGVGPAYQESGDSG